MFISSRFNEIKNEFDNNKNSHSYIFYTNDFFSCQKDVYNLVKSIFNTDDLDKLQSDFVIINKSDKKNIVKEDMLDLIKNFHNTSYLNNKRIYLIEEAHKLNSTTSNMILKFLEEPLNGVIALFITDNLDAVISTIKSRCQIINAIYDINRENDFDNETKMLNDNLFNKNKYINIVNIKKEYEKYERNELIIVFKKLLDYFYTNLENSNIYKIKLLNEGITLLTSNVNVDYVFDYILLKRK